MAPTYSFVRQTSLVVGMSTATWWFGLPLLRGLLAGRDLRGTSPAAALDGLTGCLAEAGAVGCLIWLWAAVVTSVLSAVPGALGRCATTVSGRITPAVVRRTVGGMVGAAVIAGPAGPAFAAQGTGPGMTASATATATVVPTVSSAAAAALRDLPLPERPTATAVPIQTKVPAHTTGPAIATAAPRRALSPGTPEVVVHRGDTLWDIASRHLGPGASSAEIAAAWPQWWRANVEVIGDDPDLLRPGQILTAPR